MPVGDAEIGARRLDDSVAEPRRLRRGALFPVSEGSVVHAVLPEIWEDNNS